MKGRRHRRRPRREVNIQEFLKRRRMSLKERMHKKGMGTKYGDKAESKREHQMMKTKSRYRTTLR